MAGAHLGERSADLSVFFVAEWTAVREKLPDLEQAVQHALEHVRQEQPSVKSARCWRKRFGEGLPGFIWMEEFESQTAMEESERAESTPACAEVWNAIYACVVPGTYTTTLWIDRDRAAWFER
jgi:hypothetical protein